MAPKKPIEVVYRQVGARIEQIRSALGWTQQELAAKVGLNRASICNIEKGNQRILLDDVEKFARAFSSTPKNLMRGIWF
jgi:transcriptional regulator with XRE-family HTH domain